MKKIFLAVALMASSMVSACATIPVGAVTGPAPILGATTLDEKALYGAEALYNVPAQAYVSAMNHGYITPALKVEIKPKLVAAYDVLLAVRAAYKVGDAAGFNERVSALGLLSADLQSLIPSAGRNK
jgi:hypothetical protein